jgi:hypothetical protein
MEFNSHYYARLSAIGLFPISAVNRNFLRISLTVSLLYMNL